ncbi:MAG TPA: glutamate-1-semialdehyde 2,1-aminomutase [Dehalococcoidia bacterium]|nr:glutamate-1-semialdehyde 2,1-aminomutase [Dehalococcoidia bacterium]
MTTRPQSARAFADAQRVLPGGVDSPVRAFKAVGGEPPVIASAEGAYLTDVDGNRYVDYVCAYGPLILGHAPGRVVRALEEAARRGTAFGAPTEQETALAERVIAAVPSIEKVRFVNSGTEATMTAIRLARGYTGRNKVLKFAGCYHGHSDGLLAKAGSGVATLALPDTAGVPPAYAAETLVVPFNDLEAVRAVIDRYGDDLAAVIVEPIAANMGVVLPADGYLQGLRDLTRDSGSVLIFDEVISGFRVHRGGAQALFGVTPDLTCLGKIIGGGLPVGALGGDAEIMDHLAPTGPVYQAGTLSGNPLAMSAGIETLDAIAEEGFYDRLDAQAARLADGLTQAARQAEVDCTVTRIGSILTGFFQDQTPTNYDAAAASDTEAYARYFHAMLDGGVNLAPAQFEAMFVSAAHDDPVIDATVAAAERAFQQLHAGG